MRVPRKGKSKRHMNKYWEREIDKLEIANHHLEMAVAEFRFQQNVIEPLLQKSEDGENYDGTNKAKDNVKEVIKYFIVGSLIFLGLFGLMKVIEDN